MTPGQRLQTARLFATLEYGEQLARVCAKAQSRLVDDARSRRFLRIQALQEAAHAQLFKKAADWLAPERTFRPPTALLNFGDRLQHALSHNDLTESLVASQIVLEGLGEQILSRLNRGMDRYGIGFSRQRRLLMRQEQGHFAFGVRTLETQIRLEHTRIERVHELAEDYLHQIRSILSDMAEVFTALDEDASDYTDGLVAGLPAWLDPDCRTAITAVSHSA